MASTETTLPQTDHPRDKGKDCPLPPSLSPVDRYVIEYRGEFLKDYYTNDGLFFCDSLVSAKQFHSLRTAEDACRVLGVGQVKRVIVDARGNFPRIALLHSHRKDSW